MTVYTVVLPLLAGTSKDARRLVAAAGLPADLTGVEVHLDGSATLAGTRSFADAFVDEVLLERGARCLVVDNVGASLGHLLFEAAKQRSVTGRLIVHIGPFTPPADTDPRP